MSTHLADWFTARIAMSIAAITEIVPPPKNPVETGLDVSWKEVESELGVELPNDYKEFIQTYGTGNLADFIHVFNPFAESQLIELRSQVVKISESNRYLQENSLNRELVPYPVFPESPGLLPWARNDAGQYMYWLTRGDASEWPVVLGASRSPDHEEFDMPMTSFLTAALSHELNSEIWNDDFPDPDIPLLFYPAKKKRRKKP